MQQDQRSVSSDGHSEWNLSLFRFLCEEEGCFKVFSAGSWGKKNSIFLESRRREDDKLLVLCSSDVFRWFFDASGRSLRSVLFRSSCPRPGADLLFAGGVGSTGLGGSSLCHQAEGGWEEQVAGGSQRLGAFRS